VATAIVRVGFIVTLEGRVVAPNVVSSTHTAFESLAVDAVRRWVFRPGRKNGRNVNTRVEVPVIFRVR
jgi:protein TonB